MTSCCPPPRMRWSGATGAIARCKRVSTGCGRKSRSGRVWRWICGVKPKPKAGNKPLHHFIVHGLDKPGSSATVSDFTWFVRLPNEHWVGTGRVALRYVSPCPPLDPYVRLSPHTAHDRGILWERSISPAPRHIHHGQLCAFAGYLCTVSRPSPSGPSPSVLVLVCPAFLGSDYYAPFDCLQGLGAFGPGLPSLLPTLLAIPFRLSRVQNGGRKQDAVGGV